MVNVSNPLYKLSTKKLNDINENIANISDVIRAEIGNNEDSFNSNNNNVSEGSVLNRRRSSVLKTKQIVRTLNQNLLEGKRLLRIAFPKLKGEFEKKEDSVVSGTTSREGSMVLQQNSQPQPLSSEEDEEAPRFSTSTAPYVRMNTPNEIKNMNTTNNTSAHPSDQEVVNMGSSHSALKNENSMSSRELLSCDDVHNNHNNNNTSNTENEESMSGDPSFTQFKFPNSAATSRKESLASASLSNNNNNTSSNNVSKVASPPPDIAVTGSRTRKRSTSLSKRNSDDASVDNNNKEKEKPAVITLSKHQHRIPGELWKNIVHDTEKHQLLTEAVLFDILLLLNDQNKNGNKNVFSANHISEMDLSAVNDYLYISFCLNQQTVKKEDCVSVIDFDLLVSLFSFPHTMDLYEDEFLQTNLKNRKNPKDEEERKLNNAKKKVSFSVGADHVDPTANLENENNKNNENENDNHFHFTLPGEHWSTVVFYVSESALKPMVTSDIVEAIKIIIIIMKILFLPGM
ncbi:hypothetical protein ADEAN_000982700 [Angomonas deanei]|uniref:Uncharacterized protein n=1 Tax=Angomonas deanei TaxID=59799 RepID=A0A7G2CSU6_9TRYP|nr:hypothetical protein ADEAN_000982700 [Angomonas deanei]